MIRFRWGTLLVVLVLLAVPPRISAQDTLTQTFTSENGTLTFRYPEEWMAMDLFGNICLGNSEDAVFRYGVKQELNPGQIAGRVVEPDLFDLMLLENDLPLDAGLDEVLTDLKTALADDYPPGTTVEGPVMLDYGPQRMGILRFLQEPPAEPDPEHLDRLIVVVEMDGGALAALNAETPTGELPQAEPVLLAIAETLSYTPLPIPEPGVALDLTETFTSRDGVLSFRYPQGWLTQDAGQGLVFSISSSKALNRIDYIMPGQAAIAILSPPITRFVLADSFPDSAPGLRDVVEYMAANLSEYQTGPNTPTARSVLVGERRAARLDFMTKAGDVIALAIDVGDSQTVTVMVLTAPGERELFNATGLAIAESMIYDMSGTPQVATWLRHARTVWDIAYSADGTVLASAGLDGVLRLWDMRAITPDGRVLQTVVAHDDEPVCAAAFSPDGTILATGGVDDTARLWDVSDPAAVGAPLAILESHTTPVCALAFSPDGTLLVTGSRDGTLGVWDVATQELIAVLEGHVRDAQSLAFSPDGTLLASVGDDGTLRLWDMRYPAAGGDMRVLELGHHLRAVAFSPDGTRLVTAGRAVGDESDPVVRVWNVSEALTGGDPLFDLGESSADMTSLAFSPDGAILATGGRGTIRLWDAVTGGELAVLDINQEWLASLAFSPDGALLVSADDGGAIRVWDMAQAVGR